ncbi:PREDICTED: uncharacterized protein LOC106102354 [Papilio polytes]|uniref:uncharacterized protein LOC106102354 n=1 Tax=Papilio polytes TaxID=76194 RepID=UPI00067690D8|nr:PREDICTED: uncharacterized protein LOC106102354 [Papilio polytes]
MSDMSKLKSFSVPEEAFESFQAASIHKEMDLNAKKLSIPIPACASNVEISSTIADEVQSVNSTSTSHDTAPTVESSKICLKHKAHNMSQNKDIDSTLKDQQVSTTQESSETVNEEDDLQDNLEKYQVLFETNIKPRRLRGRPLKRRIGRPKQKLQLKKQENNTEPRDKIEATEEILITKYYTLTENQVADSTTSQIPNKTNIDHENGTQENKPTICAKPEHIINSNTEDSLNKIDNNMHTVKLNNGSILHTPDCVEIKYNNESDDDPDEISLSKLKKTLTDLDNENALVKSEETESQILNEVKVIKTDKNTKIKPSQMLVPVVVVVDDNNVKVQTEESPVVDIATSSESSSGRPQRKRGKVKLHYDDGSDEDPFANIEISDDDNEPRRSKKSKRYNSDDEYIPDEKCEKKISTDSDIDKDEEELKKPRKKRNNKGLKRKQKNSDSETILDCSQSIDIFQDKCTQQDDDMEVSIINSEVKKISSSCNSWGNTNEFENFLAQKIQGTNLKIKRVTNKENSAITHLEIPVIDSFAKTADVYSQTNITKHSSTGVQTTSHSEIHMEKSVPLTTVQAEEACEFLTDMVKATSKLGELMTQKSDDFVQKKINTTNLTDTVKMDHYVKKSLLLFKLAKDSIMDIEQNLAMKYEDFLKEHKLSRYASVPKLITPTVALKDNDSDCEIVEETKDHKQNAKGKNQSKLNLKTVFLNKELSIKIAKKPSEEQKIKTKINIKGKNPVWISDSVLVKKVKPTQSFLAQDSRNKKPPDIYVTNEMVSDFFKEYYQANALTCDYLLQPEWQNWSNQKIWQNRVWCFYFSVETNNNDFTYFQSSVNAVSVNDNTNTNANCDTVTICINPKSLFMLSIQALQKKNIEIKNNDVSHNAIGHKHDTIADLKIYNAEKLSSLCLHKIKHVFYNTRPNIETVPKTNVSLQDEKVSSLKILCYHRIIKKNFLFNNSRKSDNTCIREKECNLASQKKNMPLLYTSDRKLDFDTNIQSDNSGALVFKSKNSLIVNTVAPLQTLCYHTIIQKMYMSSIRKNNNTLMIHQDKKIENLQCSKVNSLLSLCLKVIWCYQKCNIKSNRSNKENNKALCKQVETLISLCLNVIQSNQKIDVGCIEDINKLKNKNNTMSLEQVKNIDDIDNSNNLSLKQNDVYDKCIEDKFEYIEPKSLKYNALSSLLHIMSNQKNVNVSNLKSNTENTSHTNHDNYLEHFENKHEKGNNLIKSVPFVSNPVSVKPLFQLCYERVKFICNNENMLDQNSVCNSIQINSVNTVPEEVFFNIQNVTSNFEDCHVNSDDEEHICDDYLFDSYSESETHIEDYNSESKQLMEEVIPPTQTNHNNCFDHGENTLTAEISNTSIPHIKIEPIENYMEENIAEIKTEPDADLMPRIQCIQAAKLENFFETPNIHNEVVSSFCHEFDSIEPLLNPKGIKQVIGDKNNHEQKVFSQSSLRIRRQFEPDSDDENDNNMSLLVPDTYEPLDNVMIGDIIPSVNHLLEEEEKIEKKKKRKEKRIEKKKNKSRTSVSKDIDGIDEQISNKEIDVIKEKASDKITQDEEEAESSDSDSLSMVLSSRRKKKTERDIETELQTNSEQKATTDEIQCNDVDSTQEMNENYEPNEEENNTEKRLTGLQEYNKYVNDLYSKFKKKDKLNATREADATGNEQCQEETEEMDRSFSPALNSDEPIELLQCEPSLPFLVDIIENRKSKKNVNKSKTLESNGDNISVLTASDSSQNTFNLKYIVNNDSKLCQQAIVALEKLPETVTKAYFKSQGIKYRDNNSFKREEILSLLDQTESEKAKIEDRSNIQAIKNIMIENDDESNDSNSMAPFGEDTNDIESLPDVPICERPINSSKPEDCIEMELEELVKREEEENSIKEELLDEELKYTKSLLSRKVLNETKDKTCNDAIVNNDTTLLTADKMMKTDLLLLNGPVVENKEITVNPSNYPTKSKRKSDGTTHKDDINAEDCSSSEEEKQWVTTKEKLLKRQLKKKDDTSMDAAKRAKMVSQYVTKCKTTESRHRYTRSVRSRRENFLERQKQLKVLSEEGFGECSNEPYQLGKKSSQSFRKGRRNIRRVIDKKSLANSTLSANMEELNRKSRLLYRQNKLREILGCEEGVNVVVINDEVCLEYDFEENRPIVTVHHFFTQVMKAHQYEGVKFMWDACFESLELVRAGHAGGGCILAHCMGLGKTLQVLALLHTVLTHPDVGIRRVLVVCPLSTVLNWVDEINKWMGPVNKNIKVFELSKLKKTYERAYQLEDWYTAGGIFIMGYEMFRNLSTLDAILDDIRPNIVNKIRTALLDPGPDVIICDEGHLLKNDSSVLAVAISRIKTKRRIVLTGTPMQNNLREYYCMVNFVKPNLLGLYSEFANRFENPIINGQHRDSREEDIKLMKARTHILHKVLEGCLQRQEAAVLYPYLPKKHEYTAFIPLTDCQTELYKHYMKHYAQQAKHNVLKDYHILQKIWTHPQVLHNFQSKNRDANRIKVEKFEDDLACEDLAANEDVKPSQTEVWWLEYLEGGNKLDSLESSNKLYAVFRILDECIALGDKVLIFSTSLNTMDTLEYFLKKIKKWSLGCEYFRLDGSVPAEVRQNWCREFNSPNNNTTNLFLISTRAGCLGLNMTAANRVIILDTSWNPAHDIQSIFRVYRFGQKKDCYIYRLVAMGTMEQKIYERSVTKQAVACRVVDSQQIDRHYNMDELTELYKFDETGAGVESGVAAGVTDVALLRVARDAPLHAVHEHDSLLRDSHDQHLPEHERAAAWKQFEMEQGHSHMANHENNLLRTPTKKNHGHDYPLSPSLANDNSNTLIAKSKGKKGKKSKPKDQDMVKEEVVDTDSPSTDATNLTPEIQQIKKILVQQNLKDDLSVENNIEQLVEHVQKVAEARLRGEKCHAAPLVDSLARVFLKMKAKNMATADVQTPTSVVDKEGPTIRENNRKVYKNKRKRQSDITEKIPVDNIEETANIVDNKKRRAAIKAKEYMNSINIKETNDEDGSWSQEDFCATSDTRQRKRNTIDSDEENDQAVNLRSSDQISTEDDNKTDKADKSETLMVEIPDDEDPSLKSIVLSDDETVLEEETKSAESIEDCATVESDEERIPLHASLLVNQYFIKVVANKYLEGNPLLDKDAALHAARYSVQKALKEIQEDGKNLYSGPLYDIAVNSIGIDKLKQLHEISKKTNPESDSTKQSKDSTRKDKHVASQSESNPAKDDVSKSRRKSKNKSKPKSEIAKESAKRQERISSTDSDDLVLVSDEMSCEKTKSKQPISNKTNKTERESLKSTVKPINGTLTSASTSTSAPATTLAPAPASRKKLNISTNLRTEQDLVIPIQLIKSSSNSTMTMRRPSTPVTEECILPDDDDDVCYITGTTPTASSSRSTASPLHLSEERSGDEHSHRKTAPIASTKSNVQPTTVQKKVPPRSVDRPASSVDLDNELANSVRYKDNQINTKGNSDVICLVSEDEDDSSVSSEESQPSTENGATTSQSPLPPNPVFISMIPSHTIAAPSATNQTLSQTQILNSTKSNATIGIINQNPLLTPVSFSHVQCTNNAFTSNANGFCKPGDLIKINQSGEMFLLNPNQTSVTRLLPTPMPTVQNTPINTANSIVGKVAIRALRQNPPPLVQTKRGGSRKVPSVSGTIAQDKPASMAPKLTIAPLEPTKKKDKPAVNHSIVSYYPNKKIKVIDSKRNNEVITDCLDLTDNDYSDVPKKPANKYNITNVAPHASNVKRTVSVVGSPKDFMIVRSGHRSKLETLLSRKRKEPTMPALGRLDLKKKLTTPEVAGPSKKTKTPPTKKFTLQDFNIDIDDDIIELE